VEANSGCAPVDIYVDIDALGELRSRLTSLSEVVQGLRAKAVCAGSEQLGGPEIATAVEEFTQRWRGGREQVGEKLNSCAELLTKAIPAYYDTEKTLADATKGQADKPPTR
jgi:hypothetical protein